MATNKSLNDTKEFKTVAIPPYLTLFIDAHVHIHDCYQRAKFFYHAYNNLSLQAVRVGDVSEFAGVLMFTETSDDHYFARLWQAVGSDQEPHVINELGGWTLTRTQEPYSLLAQRDTARLILIAGRQVAAREGLEILVIGTTREFQDGLPIREVLEQARLCGALRVIPWGAGKWLFGRGQLLSDLINSTYHEGDLFLGDESGRPIFWQDPKHFLEADCKGIRNLPGTDPLPFPWEETRAGRFGFWMRAGVDYQHPAESILEAIRDPATELHPFGELERPLRFLRNQAAMQLRKYRRPQHITVP